MILASGQIPLIYAGKDIGIASIKRYHAVRADCMLYMDYVTTCHNYTLQGTNISPW